MTPLDRKSPVTRHVVLNASPDAVIATTVITTPLEPAICDY